MEKATTPSGVTLSVIIITKNEAANIRDCLASVSFADEIIVLDSGSTDGTPELARAMGARVENTSDWPGFGLQKNRALDEATGEWVLSVDADERVIPELADSIRQAMMQSEFDAFKTARLSNFCGRFLRHGGWWPDYVVRLFRRGSARFTEAVIHEKVAYGGPVGTLAGHLEHYPYDNLDSVLTKINRYSGDAAASMHARGKQTSIAGVVGHSIWTFVRIYGVRRGFLDGRHGFLMAATAAAGSFFRYAKLWLLNR